MARTFKDLGKTKIWLYEQPFFVDDEQLKVINTRGVKEEHAHEFVTTGKVSDHIKRCIELAAKEKQAPAAAPDKNLDAAIEKAIAKLLAEYDLVKKK